MKHVSFKTDTFDVILVSVLIDCSWKSILTRFYKLLDVAKYWNARTINSWLYIVFPTLGAIALRCGWRTHFLWSISMFFKYLVISSKTDHTWTAITLCLERVDIVHLIQQWYVSKFKYLKNLTRKRGTPYKYYWDWTQSVSSILKHDKYTKDSLWFFKRFSFHDVLLYQYWETVIVHLPQCCVCLNKLFCKLWWCRWCCYLTRWYTRPNRERVFWLRFSIDFYFLKTWWPV